MTETVTITFVRQRSPHQWSATAEEIPGAIGLGDSMTTALASLIENLPNILISQRTALEDAQRRIQELKR
jgi:hypothetical protein